MAASIPASLPNNTDQLGVVPFKRLWQMVLIQALLEADGAAMQGIDPKARKRQISEARMWLRAEDEENKRELKLICENAGLVYDKVITFARRKFSK